MTADITLTIGQLAALGASIVAGSFALNVALVKYVAGQVKAELAHLAALLEAPDGLLVRAGQLETRVAHLEQYHLEPPRREPRR